MSDHLHPQHILFDTTEHDWLASKTILPVCDHYCGNLKFFHKALQLQNELAQRDHYFDITVDCEDGADVHNPVLHAETMANAIAEARLAQSNASHLIDAHPFKSRIGIRIHDASSLCWQAEIEALCGVNVEGLDYITIPKVTTFDVLHDTINWIDQRLSELGWGYLPPIHVLIETHDALAEVNLIAQHPRVQSLSFGIMDFVSAHHGAIDMRATHSPLQFSHPLIMRAKTALSAACHAVGKVASHNVCTQLASPNAAYQDAKQAHELLGFQRMWSIHPTQIEPIIQALQPNVADVQQSCDIIEQAMLQGWAPIRYENTLHDRASYRYFWHKIVQAQYFNIPLSSSLTRLLE